MRKEWQQTWTVNLGPDCYAKLPLVKVNDSLSIYSYDSMGKTDWNKAAAASLYTKLRSNSLESDIIVTAEAKALGLAQELSGLFGHSEHVVLRKSVKVFMQDLIHVDVKSITSSNPQTLYLEEYKIALLKGKKILVLDDVTSTLGTLEAVWELMGLIGCQDITAFAVVLTEGNRYTEFKGLPLISLDHIPLPT